MLRILSFFMIFCTMIDFVKSEELKVAFAGDRPPYCFQKDGLIQGIEIDLLRAAMAQFGHTIKIVIVPKVRLQKALEEREVDAAATVQNNQNNGFYFSNTYLEFQNVAISRVRDKVIIRTIADLNNYPFVTWQEAWKNLGAEFATNYQPDKNGRHPSNYFEANSQLSQNKMFWAGRVRVIIIDKTIFEHHRRLLGTDFDTSIPIVIHPIFKEKTRYSVAFRERTYRNQFDEGMKNLKGNLTYQKIIEAYK
ncbi:substrate-binding periplasmic protein [Undibacterium fentianense]|uniref:Transporter substrate-binding domain-containing protein n=1 Tax=Undibacterium fentianense TaxID=2828728 RepID=A0A941E1B5_9BURK|nr:transporter substrate-binding domain-containing protein [Undibacterium fentianense]MBR7799551.1 transporter substrate-binding domain-containing protein [Undibacterium fentianense]